MKIIGKKKREKNKLTIVIAKGHLILLKNKSHKFTVTKVQLLDLLANDSTVTQNLDYLFEYLEGKIFDR